MSMRVAIIGAGPAGLALAIFLSKLDFVTVTVYEKKDEVSEIGAGISVQPNTWRLLGELGAVDELREEVWRPGGRCYMERRNGRTGELLVSHEFDEEETARERVYARCHRRGLQRSLLKRIDPEKIKTGHRLVGVKELPCNRILIEFSNGVADTVDVLVGADGIRSVVRTAIFLGHQISYSGRTSYRTLVRKRDVEGLLGGEGEKMVFWHGAGGKYVYTSPLGDGLFEITALVREGESEERSGREVSWGVDVGVGELLRHFGEFYEPVQSVLKLAKSVQKYALFSGTRMKKVNNGPIALIGDASHPLSGAFGNGCGFAFEDAYALYASLQYAHQQNKTVSEASQMYDKFRSPHYEKLYAILDTYAANGREVRRSESSSDEKVERLVRMNWSGDSTRWVYAYDVVKAFREVVEGM